MSRRFLAAAGSVLSVAAAIIYLLRVDDYAGLIIDDAWYMVLGKSLASGEGFRLISSAAAPIVPSVPPGFPALLAIVFKINSTYPDNLWALKAVSLLAMAGVGVACWIYYTRDRGVPRDQALWMVFAVVLTPAFVFLATSTVMPECVFTLAQLAAVIAIERAVRRAATDLRMPIIAGLLAGATLLLRTAGVALIGAAVVFFVVRRRFRQGAVFAVVVAATILPWQWYAIANAPTDEERLANGGSIAYTYSQLVAMERPGAVFDAVSPMRRLQRAARNVQDMLTRDVGAIFLPALYRGPHESGEELISVGRPLRGSMGVATGTIVVSALLSLLILAGVIRSRAWFSLPALLIAASLVVISSVGSQTFRYVVPLAPFLMLFLWRGIAHAQAARVAVLCVLGLHLIDHALYLRVKSASTPVWLAEAREVESVMMWMDANLPPDSVIVSTNPGLVYLRIGRKGLMRAFPDKNWTVWKERGIRYVASLGRSELPHKRFNARILHQTKGGLWVVEM